MVLPKLTPYHSKDRRIQYVYTDPAGNYWVSVTRDGKRKRKNCGQSLKKARFYAENLNLLFPNEKPKSRMVLSELAEHYRPEDELNNASHLQHRYQEAQLIRILDDPLISEITVAHVHRYQTERSKEKNKRRAGNVGPATVNSETARLCALLSLATRDGLLPFNPLLKHRKLKTPPGRTRTLSWAEEAELAQVFDEEFFRLVQIALLSGMRKEEQLTVTRDQILFEQSAIYLPRTKNSEARYVPMSDKLTELVELQLELTDKEGRSSPWLCPNRSRKNRWQERNLSREWNKGKARAGITNLHWHDLRHTCATRLVAAGVDIAIVKEILGHSDIRVTDRYSHASREQLLRAVKTQDQTTPETTPR